MVTVIDIRNWRPERLIVAGVGQRAIQGDNDDAGDWLRNPANWDVWGA